LPPGSESRRRPLTRPPPYPPPQAGEGRVGATSPRAAGRGERKSFSRRVRARALFDSPPLGQKTEGRRSADRRIQPLSAPHTRTLPPECARARKRPQRGPLASRRSATALVSATEHLDSAQAALRAMKTRRRYLRFWIALKRSTSRAGRNAGGDDARTARERGYKPRPQEPHSPHQSAVTGRRP